MGLGEISTERLAYLRAQRLTHHDQFGSVSSNPALLSILSTIDRTALAQLVSEEDHCAGDIICQEHADGNSMYFIWSGQVVVFKGPIDNPHILGYRGPGEVIGEMTLLENYPRSATVVALDKLRLLKVSRERFQSFLSNHPKIGLNIMTTLSSRLRRAESVHVSEIHEGQQLALRVSELLSREQQLLEAQRVRQETCDLIIHDLRNPLSIIEGAVQMLAIILPETVLEENRELLNIAQSASRRMKNLVDTLLETSRLESGNANLQLEKNDFALVSETIVAELDPAARKKEIALQSQLPDNIPPIIMDREKIERVLSNLIDNAIKYTPKHGRITISALARDNIVQISVTDSGPGIPNEERERVFDRFTQISNSQPHKRGFGLGLNFCKLAVEAHSGHIWVESGERNNGSRFVFTLPIDGPPHTTNKSN